MKKILFLLALALPQLGKAQSSDTAVFNISIDPTALSYINTTSSGVLHVFTDAAANSIVAGYHISEFAQTYPSSQLNYLRNVYHVRCNSAAMGAALHSANAALFSSPEKSAVGKLCFTPNDWNSALSDGSDYLDYINARQAWDHTHGDKNTIIGVVDEFINMYHPDFLNSDSTSKLYAVGINLPEDTHHGTAVASVIASATNNGKGLPAIGFDCRMDFVSAAEDDDEVLLMSRRGRRIINCSWYHDADSLLNLRARFSGQQFYNEIYENGSFVVWGAANGKLNEVDPNFYVFPASYDNMFSVSSIGWKNDKPATVNVKGMHEFVIGDTTSTFNHNTRVDLCAPSSEIGAAYYDDTSSLLYYHGTGTSVSAPMVAGTAGLLESMLHQKDGAKFKDADYSPYQLEWLLKTTAETDFLSYPENARYAGRLGAGRLNAEKAVIQVEGIGGVLPLDPNNLATQTMFIQGIGISMVCAPGYSSNGAKPKLSPVIVNGTSPYQYVWEAVPLLNHATLDNESIAEPTVVGSTGNNVLYYRLTVYDASLIQKVAMKTFKIQLTTAPKRDMAMQDSYMDMLNEPNDQRTFDSRNWDTWTSPDVWNRQHPDGGTDHQNPEYFSVDSNYAYVRIRNIGCAASSIGGSVGSSYLHLYWSKGSTGENWDVDWTVRDVAAAVGPPIAGGREITTGSGITLPILQPGESIIVKQGWRPPHPEDYEGRPSSFDLCLLARIVEHLYIDSAGNRHSLGMTINELTDTGVGINCRNNNNIVTRNMVLTNLNPYDFTDTRQLIIANGNSVPSVFNVDFGSDRSIFKHFAGDFSSLGHVTLHLGGLFDVWVAGGGAGTVASSDPVNKTVTFNGATTLQLNGLMLGPDERYTIGVEFTLDSGAVINDTSRHIFFARQFDQSNPDEVYGAMNYQLTVTPGSHNTARLSQNNSTINKNATYKLSPNPTANFVQVFYTGSDTNPVAIAVTDMAGKQVWTERYVFGAGTAHNINLAQFPSGVYLINITNAAHKTETYKVVKE